MALGDIFKKTIVIDEKGASETSSSVASMLKTFGGFAGATLLIKGMYNEMQKNVQASIAQEQTFKKLETAVNLTGVSYKENEKALKELFATQQAYTQYGDTDSAAMLTQLMQLTGDYKKSIEGLSIAQDLAATGLFDMNTAARYVGMALTGNVTMLGRYIPQLKETNPELKALATNEEKAAYAMNLLNEKFGGTARANLETTAGAIKQMKNYAGDLREEIGDRLSPAVRDGALVLKEFFARATETSLETTIRQLKEMGVELETINSLTLISNLQNALRDTEKATRKLNQELNTTTLPTNLLDYFTTVEKATGFLSESWQTQRELFKDNSEALAGVDNAFKDINAQAQQLAENLDNEELSKKQRKELEAQADELAKQSKELKDLRDLLQSLVDAETMIKQIKEGQNDLTKEGTVNQNRQTDAVENTTDAVEDNRNAVIELSNAYDDIIGKVNQYGSILTDLTSTIGDFSSEMQDIEVTKLEAQLDYAQQKLDDLRESEAYQNATDEEKRKMESGFVSDVELLTSQLNDTLAKSEAQAFQNEQLIDSFNYGIRSIALLLSGDIAGGLATFGTGFVNSILDNISFYQYYKTTYPDVNEYAGGGVADYPQLATLAEDGKPEGILNNMAYNSVGGRAGVDALNSGQPIGNTYIVNNYIDTYVGNKEYLDRLGKDIKERMELGFV